MRKTSNTNEMALRRKIAAAAWQRKAIRLTLRSKHVRLTTAEKARLLRQEARLESRLTNLASQLKEERQRRLAAPLGRAISVSSAQQSWAEDLRAAHAARVAAHAAVSRMTSTMRAELARIENECAGALAAARRAKARGE